MPEIDLPALADSEWVFLALFNCIHCGREVTVRHYAGDSLERRAFRHLRACEACSAARGSHADSGS